MLLGRLRFDALFVHSAEAADRVETGYLGWPYGALIGHADFAGNDLARC